MSDTYAAVIGAGTMGLGIAYVLAAAGEHVHIVEPDVERADATPLALKEIAVSAVKRGKLDDADATGLLSRIGVLPAVTALAPVGASLVVEAVPERVELKRSVVPWCVPAPPSWTSQRAVPARP